ncbi:hypothetical protein K8I28_02855 [bacterium]|nr:hypothetical protein [bacterium]
MIAVSIIAPRGFAVNSNPTDSIRAAGMSCCMGAECNCGDDCPGMMEEPLTCVRTTGTTSFSLTAIPVASFIVFPITESALFSSEGSDSILSGHTRSLEKPPRNFYV